MATPYHFAVVEIFGDEWYNVVIIEEDGKFFAECDSIMQRRRLTDSNYLEVLNDMFYDYCIENADWMGVS